MRIAKRKTPIKNGERFTLMASASIPEIERMFGLVRYASRAILRTRYFEVDTSWRVVQKSVGKVVIKVSNKRTQEWIATVQIEVPNFANSL
jgi:hypothetical protein